MLYNILLLALSLPRRLLSLPRRILRPIEQRIFKLREERQEKSFREDLARTEGYSFTYDWMSQHIPNWLAWLASFRNQPGVRMLEIGSYEGRSAIWFLENILSDPTAHLTCIDLFSQPGGLRFDHNLRVSGQRNKVTKIQGHSVDILPGVVPSSMDIIYLDGSHRACDVLMDGALGWRLLKPAGVMIFDDYVYHELAASERPQTATDLFLEMCAGQYTLLSKGDQVAIRKQS